MQSTLYVHDTYSYGESIVIVFITIVIVFIKQLQCIESDWHDKIEIYQMVISRIADHFFPNSVFVCAQVCTSLWHRNWYVDYGTRYTSPPTF